MHELSIADGIVRQTVAIAAEHHAVRVEEVRVEVGSLMLVVPEALEQAWEVLREGTVAAEATLKITEVPARAECRGCGYAYAVQVQTFQCPQCCLADPQITAGNDIILASVVCLTQEEVKTHED